MALKLTTQVEIEIPSVPFFVRVTRQGKDAGNIPVGDLSNKDLRKLADAWRDALVTNAEKQRKQSSGS